MIARRKAKKQCMFQAVEEKPEKQLQGEVGVQVSKKRPNCYVPINEAGVSFAQLMSDTA